MIKLISGKQVEYDENFDVFFMTLLENIISEAKNSMEAESETGNPVESKNERLVKEIMDNCIYVTHQLFEISRKDENLSKFIVTGFLFNSIMLTLTHSNLSETLTVDSEDLNDENGDDTVH